MPSHRVQRQVQLERRFRVQRVDEGRRHSDWDAEGLGAKQAEQQQRAHDALLADWS